MTITFLILGLAIYFAYMMLDRSLFHPAQVFILLWSVLCFVYQLYLSPILSVLDHYTWILIALWVLSFFAGSSSYDILKSSYKGQDSNNVHDYELTDRVIIKSLLALSFFLLLYLIEGIIMTPPMFAGDIYNAYMDARGLPFIHYGVGLMTFTIPLGIYLLTQKKLGTLIKLTLLFLIFSQLLAIISWLQRGLLLTALLSSAYIYYANTKRKKRFLALKLTGFLAVIAILASILGNYRSSGGESFGGESVAIFKLMGRHSKSIWQLPFNWAYLYSTTSIQNLDQCIEKDLYEGGTEKTYGLNTFGFILNPIQLNKIYRSDDAASDFEIVHGFNVPTAFFPIYKDFGPFLSLLYWFFMGVFLTYVYRKSRTNPVFKILYGVSIANLIMSFHDNFFIGPLYWFGLLLLMWIFREKPLLSLTSNPDRK